MNILRTTKSDKNQCTSYAKNSAGKTIYIYYLNLWSSYVWIICIFVYCTKYEILKFPVCPNSRDLFKQNGVTAICVYICCICIFLRVLRRPLYQFQLFIWICILCEWSLVFLPPNQFLKIANRHKIMLKRSYLTNISLEVRNNVSILFTGILHWK